MTDDPMTDYVVKPLDANTLGRVRASRRAAQRRVRWLLVHLVLRRPAAGLWEGYPHDTGGQKVSVL